MRGYISEIADKNNILFQAEKLKNRKFTPGFDDMTAEKAYLWVEINNKKICTELKNGSYEPMPVTGFYTAKKNGGYRRFVKVTAIDTIVQNAIVDAVSEKCDDLFSAFSHAYRQDRGVGTALEQYCRFAEEFAFASKIDLVACYDNIDRGVLMQCINDFFEDEELTAVIMKFVNTAVFSDGVFDYPDKGLMQGMPLSNLLCNLYFHFFDIYMETEEIPFVRYADDIVVFGRTLAEIKRYTEKAVKFLNERLKLSVNEKKSRIDSSAGLVYLGHRFEKNKGIVVALENGKNSINAYNNWYERQLLDFKGTVDILSDGILRQRDYSLVFESETASKNIPVKTTDVINIYSDVVLDSGFLNKTFENGIIVNVFNSSNKLVGRFLPNTSLVSPKITNEQILKYCNAEQRLALAKVFVIASIHNTRLNIRYYNKQAPSGHYVYVLSKINNLEEKIKTCDTYESLLMYEAQVREAYYSCFDSFIKNDEFVFDKRSRRPPLNEVNAMISFGNTVLYNFLGTYIYKSPLDIRIGFLHATNNRKESLNLDVAEIFKPLLVDRVVFSLINLRSINRSHFCSSENGGLYLNEDGKRIFLRAFYEKLNTVITVKDSKQSYRTVIRHEVNALVEHIKNGTKYTGFRQVR